MDVDVEQAKAARVSPTGGAPTNFGEMVGKVAKVQCPVSARSNSRSGRRQSGAAKWVHAGRAGEKRTSAQTDRGVPIGVSAPSGNAGIESDNRRLPGEFFSCLPSSKLSCALTMPVNPPSMLACRRRSWLMP